MGLRFPSPGATTVSCASLSEIFYIHFSKYAQTSVLILSFLLSLVNRSCHTHSLARCTSKTFCVGTCRAPHSFFPFKWPCPRQLQRVVLLNLAIFPLRPSLKLPTVLGSKKRAFPKEPLSLLSRTPAISSFYPSFCALGRAAFSILKCDPPLLCRAFGPSVPS